MHGMVYAGLLHIISTKVSPNDVRINGLSYPMGNVMQESYKNLEGILTEFHSYRAS